MEKNDYMNVLFSKFEPHICICESRIHVSSTSNGSCRNYKTSTRLHLHVAIEILVFSERRMKENTSSQGEKDRHKRKTPRYLEKGLHRLQIGTVICLRAAFLSLHLVLQGPKSDCPPRSGCVIAGFAWLHRMSSQYAISRYQS